MPATAPRTLPLRALSATPRPTDLACAMARSDTPAACAMARSDTSAACAMARSDTVAARNADSVSRKESHLSAGMPRLSSDGA
ncbi:hypothetical protein DL765_004978 [Monosporascus sp. GIB2]|nr:hypothetical protein DL765_004978 [Monosporascus sp. GIB2]